jgi:hypothetical protein
VFPIFLGGHHSIIDKAEVQNFKKFVKCSILVHNRIFANTALSPKTHCYRQKRTVSLRVFGESALLHSAYLPKTNNSSSSLNMLYTAESAQFYSTFLPTTISWTPCFHRKHKVWLTFFTENAQNDPKTHSYKDEAKFNPTFLATTLSCASCFQRKRGVIKNLEELGEFKEYFQKCWLNCILYL